MIDYMIPLLLTLCMIGFAIIGAFFYEIGRRDERERAKQEALETENAKLRKLTSEISCPLFSLDVDYCTACPRNTTNHQCPIYTLKSNECL